MARTGSEKRSEVYHNGIREVLSDSEEEETAELKGESDLIFSCKRLKVEETECWYGF